ncbi:MAG: type II toxin-antitoxin system VapC family toxin [Acidobacteriota bacterium]
MSPVYLDSSAWVKRYCRETGSDRVTTLFASGRQLLCSRLGLVEVVAALARKRKSGSLSPDTFENLRGKVQADWESFWKIDLSARLMADAERIASTLALRGADAVHFASVLSIQASLAADQQQATLVASDRELVEAARAAGMPALDPELDALV